MLSYSFLSQFQTDVSKIMNANYRIKVGHNLVGYTGLVLHLGALAANRLILVSCKRMFKNKLVLRSKSDYPITIYLK